MQVGKTHASTRDYDGKEPGLFIYMIAVAFPQEKEMTSYSPTILSLMERSSILIYTYPCPYSLFARDPNILKVSFQDLKIKPTTKSCKMSNKCVIRAKIIGDKKST